jgi:hypothetical protein
MTLLTDHEPDIEASALSAGRLLLLHVENVIGSACPGGDT